MNVQNTCWCICFDTPSYEKQCVHVIWSTKKKKKKEAASAAPDTQPLSLTQHSHREPRKYPPTEEIRVREMGVVGG